ncbi:MAG TPA: TetR family transcriptional regulator [Trichocoleus sp.]
MSAQRKSTRQRLVQAALQLFAVQGVTDTTTRQIAELADVNEVTLFRHFGSKHGLLLAVLEEAEVFTQLGEDLEQRAQEVEGFAEAIEVFAIGYLQALEQIPEFVRSLVGEAGQYPIENQQAIGRGLSQIHRYTVQYLMTVLAREQMQVGLSVSQMASLLNTLLFGYAVIEFTTPFHQLWVDRQAFIANLVKLFLPTQPQGAGSQQNALPTAGLSAMPQSVIDLPAPLVRSILQTARKSGLQDYALVYVLFGAGLRPSEAANLHRADSFSDDRQHLLQITQGEVRQVPLNQWILGSRYGSYSKNPLTQWLRSRKDDHSSIFLNEAGQPITEAELRDRWQAMTAEIQTPMGTAPAIEQVRQTWCIEMLMRGMTVEGLSILSGYSIEQLQVFVRRAQEKAALEQAIRLDQRSVQPDSG